MSHRLASCRLVHRTLQESCVLSKMTSCTCCGISRTARQYRHLSRLAERKNLLPSTYSAMKLTYLDGRHHADNYCSVNYYKSKYLIPSHTLDGSRLVCKYPTLSVISVRRLHSSRVLWKEESKVEKTVKVLKEKQAAELTKPPTEATAAKPGTDVPAPPPRKSLGQKIVAEVKHYYHGFRLLFIDVKIGCRLLWSVLNGKNLSRRERRQLVRTTADLFRMVPFLVFVIIPFMEFLLPVAVKLFPNMLPSTFKEENKEQEKMKKRLKGKLEMAKFLQDTVMESAVQRQKKRDGDKESMVENFSTFLNTIRTTGTQASTEDIVKFSKLFEDEMTLDSLSRPQLQALCKVLELPTLGTDAFLRFQLRMKLRQLKADDKMIQKEGIDSLATWELQAACRSRGMRAMGVPEDRLKSQLQQWLDLHLHEQIPTSLLLLSRALYLPDTLSTADQLQATLSTLPESTAEEAKIKVAELTGELVDNKAKLDLIRLEEEAIKKEKDAQEKQDKQEEEIAQKEREEAEAIAAETAMGMTSEKEALTDTAPIIDAQATEEIKEAPEQTISAQELEEIEAALEEIADQKKLSIEKEELEDLKEDVEEYKEDVQDLKEVILSTGMVNEELQESKAAQRLAKRVDRMISQLDDRIGELQEEKEGIQEEIEVKEVRIKRSRGEKRDRILEEIAKKKSNIISINDMVLALKHYQKLPDDTRLQRIVEVLDEDKDGQIQVDNVLKVIELLGKENIKLSAGQVSEVVELIKRETELETEEKIKMKKEKEEQKSQAPESEEEKDTKQEVQ